MESLFGQYRYLHYEHQTRKILLIYLNSRLANLQTLETETDFRMSMEYKYLMMMEYIHYRQFQKYSLLHQQTDIKQLLCFGHHYILINQQYFF